MCQKNLDPKNIFIFIMIRIQEGPKTMDPKTPKTHFQQTLAVAGKNGPYVIVDI